ncbi:MAG: hypothetical protein ACYDEN_04545 [Acidimicrobiales bacterium]
MAGSHWTSHRGAVALLAFGVMLVLASLGLAFTLYGELAAAGGAACIASAVVLRLRRG